MYNNRWFISAKIKTDIWKIINESLNNGKTSKSYAFVFYMTFFLIFT